MWEFQIESSFAEAPGFPEAEAALREYLDDDRYLDDQPSVENNMRQAAWALLGLRRYAERTNVIGEEVSTALGDLLTDLHHLADFVGADFAWLIDIYYDREITTTARSPETERDLGRTQPNDIVWKRSATTSKPASSKPNAKAGSAKSKDSKSAIPASPTNSNRSTSASNGSR